jgi:hypothetical protein
MDSISQNVPESVVESFSRIASELIVSCGTSGGDLGIAESALDQAIGRVRTLLVDQALESSQSACQGEFYCNICQHELTPWGAHKRLVVTAHGEGRLCVERLHCRWCNTDAYPMIVRNALTDCQYTIGARRIIAEECAELPFARAARKLRIRGIEVSATQSDQIAQQVASWRRDEEEAVRAFLMLDGRDLNLPLHDKAPWDHAPSDAVLVASVDGAKVRSTTIGEEGQGLEWFETRAGVLSLNCDNAPKVIVAGMKEPDRLFETLFSQSRQFAGNRPMVFVADGALWIWDRVTQFFPKAVQVLDIYHAAEHVGAAARACWGEGSAQAAEWIASARSRLMAPSGVQVVLRELCLCLREGAGQCVNAEELKIQIRYLWKNRGRMRYDWLAKQGLPVGSGIMESAIKQTSSQRLRQPGMMWTRERADLMLRLRAACLSDSLDLTIQRQTVIAAQAMQAFAKAA